jgi:hypothetical protein
VDLLSLEEPVVAMEVVEPHLEQTEHPPLEDLGEPELLADHPAPTEVAAVPDIGFQVSEATVAAVAVVAEQARHNQAVAAVAAPVTLQRVGLFPDRATYAATTAIRPARATEMVDPGP